MRATVVALALVVLTIMAGATLGAQLSAEVATLSERASLSD